MGHELDKQASLKELNEASALIESQLWEWGMIEAGPSYDLYFGRSAARASERPGYSFAFDYFVQVKRSDEVVFEGSYQKDIQ